jgi:hypothetical protein
LKWPPSVQRGESAPPLDFDGTGNAWSPAQHLLLTAVESFSVHARFGGSVVEFRIRIAGIFGARNGISQGWVADWAID